MKRYTIQVELFVYAEDDKQAVEIAAETVREFRKCEDNKAEQVSIFETPFGSFEKREVK